MRSYGAAVWAAFILIWPLYALVVAGAGLTGTGSAETPLAIDVTKVRGHLAGSGTFALSMPADSCDMEVISVPGAVQGAEVVIGPPVELLSAVAIPVARVSAADTVLVGACNFTANTVNVASATWNVDVRVGTLPPSPPPAGTSSNRTERGSMVLR